jgi:hypothetical protein
VFCGDGERVHRKISAVNRHLPLSCGCLSLPLYPVSAGFTPGQAQREYIQGKTRISDETTKDTEDTKDTKRTSEVRKKGSRP